MSETEESRAIRCFACNWADERAVFVDNLNKLQIANDDLQKYILGLQDEILYLRSKCDDIVRCKDCEYTFSSDLFGDTRKRYCQWFCHDIYTEDGFCAWGKRRKDA